MTGNVELDLAQAVTGHGGQITRVVLRPPTARDYFALGEPSVYARNADGTIYSIEYPQIIEDYIRRCIVEPKEMELVVGQIGLVDGMKIKEALLDFFASARAGSKAGQNSSSGNAASSAPPNSAA